MSRTLIAAGLVLGAGLWVLYTSTLGLRAFTQETTRRVSVHEQPRPVPELRFRLQDGSDARVHDLAGRWVVVTFINTTCPSLCPLVMERMRQIRTALNPAVELGRVHFLSISFDPTNDTPRRLAAYAANFGADIDDWWVARPGDDLDAMLRFFGVTVIPVGSGMFEHNTAFYLIDREQRLVEIFDAEDPVAVTAAVRRRL